MNTDAFKDILLKHWASMPEDSAHDLAHVQRVVRMAQRIAADEGGDLSIILPAAWLHDLVNLPKNHPDRAKASVLAADLAVKELEAIGYEAEKLPAIHHAIAAHSFSAGIPAETLEAKIVQDADRLDSLGAIGMARTFAVSGALGRALFHPEDPLATERDADDSVYGLDHFEIKLYRIARTLHTECAKLIAAQRVRFMKEFCAQIAEEAAPADTQDQAA